MGPVAMLGGGPLLPPSVSAAAFGKFAGLSLPPAKGGPPSWLVPLREGFRRCGGGIWSALPVPFAPRPTAALRLQRARLVVSWLGCSFSAPSVPRALVGLVRLPGLGGKKGHPAQTMPGEAGPFLCHFSGHQHTRSSVFFCVARKLRRANASRCPWRGRCGLCAALVRGLYRPGPFRGLQGLPMAFLRIFLRAAFCARRKAPSFSSLPVWYRCYGATGNEDDLFPGPSSLPCLAKRAGSDLRRGSLALVLLSVRTAPQIRPAPAPKSRMAIPARPRGRSAKIPHGHSCPSTWPNAQTIALSGRILPHVIPAPAGHDHIRFPVPILAESIPSQKRQSGARSCAPGCRFQHHIRKAGFLLKRELCCFLQHIRKAGNQVKTCSCCL